MTERMIDERYLNMATPPQDALDEIKGGNLRGKTTINPQWRIEALTEQFGLCGIGWKFDIVNERTYECQDGQVLLFMTINLYTKDKSNNEWSAPIPGCGGDFLIEKNKNGLVPNDEAYKMVLTDALGNAAKCIGTGANVYRGLFDDKYNGRQYGQQQKHSTVPQSDDQSKPPTNQPQQAVQPPVSVIKGVTCALVNGKYYALTQMNLEQLNYIANTAAYQACHNEARAMMAEFKA